MAYIWAIKLLVNAAGEWQVFLSNTSSQHWQVKTLRKLVLTIVAVVVMYGGLEKTEKTRILQSWELDIQLEDL